MQTAVDVIGAVPLFERLDASLLERIDAITEAVSGRSRPDPVAAGRHAGMPACPVGRTGGAVQHGR